MTFTIHITHRHIEGAGLHNEYYERDIPCDEDIEIEIDDEEVNKALAEIIYDCYFKASVPYIEHSYETIAARIKKNIARLISDCDLEDTMRECFADELSEWAQEEYGND